MNIATKCTCGSSLNGICDLSNCPQLVTNMEKKYPIEKENPNDQIIANQLAGMPLEEAVFQAGYSAGYDTGYKRGKREGLPTGAVWVRASEFKTTEPIYRPYRRKRVDGEYDYGEIYVTEDAGDIFLDVDNENTYELSSFEKWNDYDILFEPNV